MKIAIHSVQFDGRGTGKTPYDYARGLQNLYQHEVVFVTSSLSTNEGLARIRKEFPVITYDKKVGMHDGQEIRDILSGIVDQQRIDFMQFLKYGNDDQITPDNCKTGIHCVFIMTEPHGDVYAGVSENLAKKFGHKLYVPHIIKAYPQTKDLRKELGIPTDALVVGRHGGFDTFDVPFVHEAIRDALAVRKDLHFVFLSTKKFYEHERITYIPWVESEEDKFNVIHACDVMIHARMMGETFGLAVGEFSAANKPVMTWRGLGCAGYDTAHVDILGANALLYNNRGDLQKILLNLNRKFLKGRNWNVYTQTFSEANVTRQYSDVFLGSAPHATKTAEALRSVAA
ncbi:MAG TPA: hypothetical protein VKC60_17135 [Opitutaceae bacterium]|nr:hypothetical protein [Opitutaceae bacterium]